MHAVNIKTEASMLSDFQNLFNMTEGQSLAIY